MTSEEKILFDRYVDAIQTLGKNNLSREENEKANEQYADSMRKLWEMVKKPDRVAMLLKYAEENALILEEKREAISYTNESEHIQQVQETFPAIDIKFLARNGRYKLPIKLDFRLGVYIFWEMIVPYLLELAEKVGCKYIYLFAADNSEESEKEVYKAPMWTPDYDPYDDEVKLEEKVEIHKLVDYYIHELKFEYVTKYKILKPHFERSCFTLVQAVNDLELNREQVWASHIAEEDA